MSIELGSNIGKLLKFDQDAGKQIFVLTVVCYLIFQMDMESLIVAYTSCAVYVMMLLQNRWKGPPKKKVFPVDVPYDSSCYDDEDEELDKQLQQQRQPQKTPGRALPTLGSDANTDTNLVLKTRLSPQGQKSQDFKSCDRIEHLSAANIVPTTKVGNKSVHKSGSSPVAVDSTTASCETKSLHAWPPGLPCPLEPQLSSLFKPDDSQLPSSPEAVRLPPGLCEPDDEGQNPHVLPPEVEQLPSSCKDPVPEGFATLPSLGADVHPDGCIPCKFLVSRTGCKDGEKCIYCHAPHPDLNQGQRRRLMSRINRKKRLEEQAIANGQSLQEDEQQGQTIHVKPCNGNSEDVQVSNFEGWYHSPDYKEHYDHQGSYYWTQHVVLERNDHGKQQVAHDSVPPFPSVKPWMQIQPSQEQGKVSRSAKQRPAKKPPGF